MSDKQLPRSSFEDPNTPTNAVFASCAAILSESARQIETTAVRLNNGPHLHLEIQAFDRIAQIVQCIADVVGAQRLDKEVLAGIPLETVSHLLQHATYQHETLSPESVKAIFNASDRESEPELW